MEIVTLIKDIVLAFAAIFTATIAYKGISKWQDELKGKTEFEAAKELLKSLLRVRNEIRRVRAAMILATEFPKGYNPLEKTARSEGDAYLHVYKNRTSNLEKMIVELEANYIECEALWGNSIKAEIDAVLDVTSELFSAVNSYIRSQYEGDYGGDDDFKKEIRAILFNLGDDNAFTQKITSVIANAEHKLLPHLKRSKSAN